MRADTPNVVILLPGLAGSQLCSTANENIWPGEVWEFHHYPERKLQLLINDATLTAPDIIRKVCLYPIYQSLIGFLGTLGYHERPIDKHPQNLFVFAYDWRRDLVQTTDKLADLVVTIFNAYQDQCSITLLAHSTGGMISRCLLESRHFDYKLGSARQAIKQLITMATAGRGAPQALGGILGLVGLLSLKPAQAKRLAAAPNYPSAYQHMPAPLTTALWDKNNFLNPKNLYEPQVGVRLGLNAGHVADAANFWSMLTYPLIPWSGTRYFCFVGSQQSTLSGFLYDDTKTGSDAADPLDIDDGGDGTVPIWSADPPGLQVQYVGGNHPTLFNDTTLKLRLAELLPPIASARSAVATFRARAGTAIDVSVEDLVLRDDGSGGRPKQIVVTLSIGEDALAQGDLIVEYRPPPRAGAANEAAWLRGAPRQVSKIAISVQSPAPRFYSVAIGKIRDFPPGQYNAYFRRRGSKGPAGHAANFLLQGEDAKAPRRKGGRSGTAGKKPKRARR